jgi:hypothetical protein
MYLLTLSLIGLSLLLLLPLPPDPQFLIPHTASALLMTAKPLLRESFDIPATYPIESSNTENTAEFP